MIRTKGEPGTGDVVQAVHHMRLMQSQIRELVAKRPDELFEAAKELQAPYDLVIFKSGNPRKRAAAIVKAVTNYRDPKVLAEISEDLGEAMVGINADEIQLLMAERGK